MVRGRGSKTGDSDPSDCSTKSNSPQSPFQDVWEQVSVQWVADWAGHCTAIFVEATYSASLGEMGFEKRP